MNAPLAIVCDDSATLGLLLGRQLETLGYRVQQLPPDQLRLPLQETPALFCAGLPGTHRNGFKLLRQLRRFHDCRSLLLSASGRSTDIAWGRAVGADAVLLRPFTLEQLADVAAPMATV